jgi:hypothetical protein
LSPDLRQHRGRHPADEKLFNDAQLQRLRTAVAELSWLLSHGYAAKAALKLVGDKHSLTERQRLAVSRAACSDASLAVRTSSLQSIESIKGEDLIIDGFNLIITVEAALSGGVLLLCRDESIRDLSSVHGSYRAVSETESAITLIGRALEGLTAKSVEWVLDRPVSNSGRLAKRILSLGKDHGWPWSAELLFNPDERVVSSGKIAITADSVILDRVARWVNLKRHLIETRLDRSWIIDLKPK